MPPCHYGAYNIVVETDNTEISILLQTEKCTKKGPWDFSAWNGIPRKGGSIQNGQGSPLWAVDISIKA